MNLDNKIHRDVLKIAIPPSSRSHSLRRKWLASLSETTAQTGGWYMGVVFLVLVFCYVVTTVLGGKIEYGLRRMADVRHVIDTALIYVGLREPRPQLSLSQRYIAKLNHTALATAEAIAPYGFNVLITLALGIINIRVNQRADSVWVRNIGERVVLHNQQLRDMARDLYPLPTDPVDRFMATQGGVVGKPTRVDEVIAALRHHEVLDTLLHSV